MYEQDGTSRHCMDHSKAVKQYSRSSADQEAPLSHELRPVSVLQLTMTYLMYNIMDLSEDDSDVSISLSHYFTTVSSSFKKIYIKFLLYYLQNKRQCVDSYSNYS